MRDFLKFTLASSIGTLIGALLIVAGVSGLFLTLVVAASRDASPPVKERSVLVFDLGLTINDTNPASTTSEAIGEALAGEETKTLPLRTAIETLEKAANDERIVGLYLDGNAGVGTTGFANLKEVRSALEKFRESGKPILAYDVNWGEREYYLSSVADEVILNPLGMIELNGLSSEIAFLAGAFEKYGIGIQVVRAGKYKSAGESFVRKQLSPENRQQTQALLDDLWEEFLTTVARHRELDANQLQAIADSGGLLMAQAAENRGLVDKVAYFDEVVKQLKELTGNDADDKTFNQISLTTYARVPAKEKTPADRASKNKIALVYAEGTIVDGEGGVREIGGDRFARQLRQLRLNDNIKAVVLRVNSPGGSATASEIIGREVQLTTDVKPVIVSMGNYAASGGYWISAWGDRIFAEPTTITGSIGVFGLLPNIQGLGNNNGITWDVVKTGEYANMQTVSRPKTASELALYQAAVDRVYQTFLTLATEARNIPKARIENLAGGRVWSGKDAQRLKLVDEIGGLDRAIAFAAEKAELGNDWRLEEYPKTRTWEERIIKRLAGATVSEGAAKPDLLTREFLKFKEELAILTTLNDPLGVYARMPFNLRID